MNLHRSRVRLKLITTINQLGLNTTILASMREDSSGNPGSIQGGTSHDDSTAVQYAPERASSSKRSMMVEMDYAESG